MNEIPPSHETEPAPHALTPEKSSIRVSQEEFINELAEPSVDKSEYARQRKDTATEPGSEGEAAPQDEQR